MKDRAGWSEKLKEGKYQRAQRRDLGTLGALSLACRRQSIFLLEANVHAGLLCVKTLCLLNR